MEQLRIGIIGVGRGEDLALYWQKPGSRAVIVGAADISEKNLQTFKENINKDAFVTLDYNELLKRDDIDAIAVTSPDIYHEEHAVAALNAGKHVFCEKPMSITVEGCDAILKAIDKSGKKFMIGHNMHYIRMFRVMKEIVDSGMIGDIKAVWVRHFESHGGDFFFHDWHSLREKTNSLLLQKGVHDIDMIHWITGKYTKKVAAFGGLDFYGGDKPNDLTCPNCSIKDTCTEALFGRRVQCAFRKEIDVEDNIVMIMELENGIKATYLQNHFTPDGHRNYTFIGTEGRLENSETDNKVWVKTRRSNKWQEYTDVLYNIKYDYVQKHGSFESDDLICKDFVSMILDGNEVLTNPMQGRMSVATACAATKSMRSGGIMTEVL
jgi:predicted dehydrogenase